MLVDSNTRTRHSSWFRTREGRRYGWEIGLIIALKLLLLVVLWFAFIKPWLRTVPPPAAIVQQFYLPAKPVAP